MDYTDYQRTMSAGMDRSWRAALRWLQDAIDIHDTAMIARVAMYAANECINLAENAMSLDKDGVHYWEYKPTTQQAPGSGR